MSRQRKFQLVIVMVLAVCIVAPCAQAATQIGKVVLNQTAYEKFGALYFPFRFVSTHVWISANSE